MQRLLAHPEGSRQAVRRDLVQRDHLEDEDEALQRQAAVQPHASQQVSRKATDAIGAPYAHKLTASKTGKNLGSVRVGAAGSRAPGNRIQREGNWDDFKKYTEGIWGKGGSYRRENQWALEAVDPRESYREHAQKGGKLNKAKGVMSGIGHSLFGLPFALAGGAMSTVGRGIQTLGAGAYYGAKGLGSSIYSGGQRAGRGLQSAGRGIKNWYNKDRNPHGYDRNRLPTTMSNTVEGGKPLLALGGSGGVGGGLESVGTGLGTPAGVGALNVLTLLDSILTWKSGNRREEEARQRGDLGGIKVGKRKSNEGKLGTAGGLMGTVQGGLNLGNVIDVGSKGMMSFNDLMGKGNFVSTGLGVAGAGLGIAGGAITAGQGLWKSGKAIQKLRALGKSAPMLTEEGEGWRARVKDREKTKLGLNALKVIGGALGIAAGALVIGSNPVGWALGIAAAATVGGLVAYKLWNKFKKSRRKKNAKKVARQEMEREDQERQELERQEQEEQPQELLEEVQNEQPNEQPNNGGENGGGGEELQEANPSKLDQEKRKRAMELGNRVAMKASKSGKVAGEIRSALAARRDPAFVQLTDDLEHGVVKHSEIKNRKNESPYPYPVLKAHDALVLIGVLNVTPEEAESESGQELIEKKLSATGSL